MNMRYDYCPDVDGTWAVLDMETGDPATVAGIELVRMQLDRAERAVGLLNERDLRRQSRMKRVA